MLESKLTRGQELSSAEVGNYQKLSADDKLYNRTLRYIAMRPRTRWEIETYIKRKQASPPLVEQILNKLSNVELIDDAKFARAFVNDRRLLRPTSRRKMIAELRKKHVASELIEEAVGSEQEAEIEALRATIAKKRRQSKYHDDDKLMQYLARQGYNYSDIKAAMHVDNST